MSFYLQRSLAGSSQGYSDGHHGSIPTHDLCIHHYFEHQAQAAPESIALVFEDQHITYRELNRRANLVAHYLHTVGVRPEILVGICVERSLELLIGMLGILKSGGVYVPLDPSSPKERLAFITRQAKLSVLLTLQRLIMNLPEKALTDIEVTYLDAGSPIWVSEGMERLDRGLVADNACYVIFTSGSTGRPKGVITTHRGVCNLIQGQIPAFGVQRGDRILQFSSPGFDASISEIFMTLCSGAVLHLSQQTVLLPGPDLLSVLEQYAITLITMSPSVMAAMSPDGNALRALRTIIAAGESCQPEHVVRWGTGRRFINAYGPTETTVCATIGVCTDGRQKPAIGTPIINTQVFILDEAGQEVSQGVVGELYIGGINLARGYLYRPDLTAERFLPHPFSTYPGQLLYRAGDLARQLSDGTLDYVGRIDHQVKIRGYRIELGEIEATLIQHPAIYECVVLVHEPVPEHKQLVAYLRTSPQQDHSLSHKALREYLQEFLPAYMVPSSFIVREGFPLTSSGKVDRAALLAQGGDVLPLSQHILAAPRTPTEEVLVSIWSEVLGKEQIGIHDAFFELGGHSLLLARVASRLREIFKREIPLKAFFAATTIAELAHVVDQTRERIPERFFISPVPSSQSNTLPLLHGQRRLWFLDQLIPNSSLYSLPLALRVSGPLDCSCLHRCILEIVRRHESLRTIFVQHHDEPEQVILPVQPPDRLFVDLSGLSRSQQQEQTAQLLQQQIARPFDLQRGPLLRLLLIRQQSQEHVLLLSMQHIIADGWSLGILFDELVRLYEAGVQQQASPLEELAARYAEVVQWQRTWLETEVMQQQLSYWTRQLAQGEPVVLPLDHPRPATASWRGASWMLEVSAEVTRGLRQVGQQEKATLFMTLVAAFQLLLSRYSGQQDISVGINVASRTHPAMELLIGFFANTLILRTPVRRDLSFLDLLRAVRETALDAYTYQDVPFDRIVEAVQPDRTEGYNPLFQVMLVSQDRLPLQKVAEVTFQTFEIENRSAKFELTISITPTEQDGLRCEFVYATDLFKAATIEQMGLCWYHMLQYIAAHPEQRLADIPLLSQTEQQQKIASWNTNLQCQLSDACIDWYIEVQALDAPDTIAVVFEDQHITYQDLNQRANQLAQYLGMLGVGPEVPVGLYMKRSLAAIIGLFGILKAGGVYVPLDPAYPHERIRHLVNDSQVQIVITQQALQSSLPTRTAKVVCIDTEWEAIIHQPDVLLRFNAVPDNLAYIIYTSGSTGVPKGVCTSHKAIVNHVLAAKAAYQLTPSDRVLQFASFSFDVSLEQLFSALASGAVIVLRSEEIWSPLEFSRHSQLLGLTVANFTPAYWQRWVTEVKTQAVSDPFSSLRLIIVGGDKLTLEAFRSWQDAAPGTVRLYNGYGPTEITITSSVCDVSSFQREDLALRCLPLGYPFPGRSYYVLDEEGSPVPTNIPGELYVGGSLLARGYLHRPDLTAEKFVPDPFSGQPGARLYRTGDLVRYRTGGELEFLTRVDNQVKIRGYRIELGEIEAVLAAQAAVKECAVVVREDGPGDPYLAAYLVFFQEQSLSPGELRQYLYAKLPQYLIPSAFVTLSKLPLTPNGKIDYKALPIPLRGQFELATASEEDALTPVEKELVSIWKELLHIEQISRYDNFFEMGGHSLVAIQIVSRIRSTFQIDFPLRLFFDYPSIAELALAVSEKVATAKILPPIPQRRHNKPPVSAERGDYPLTRQLAKEGESNESNS